MNILSQKLLVAALAVTGLKSVIVGNAPTTDLSNNFTQISTSIYPSAKHQPLIAQPSEDESLLRPATPNLGELSVSSHQADNFISASKIDDREFNLY